MLRFDRAIAAAVLLSASLSLSACTNSAGQFDPTDWLNEDWFGTKPKLQGERKPVFPEGVPGVPMGVPKELVKGSGESTESAAIASTDPTPEEKPAPPPKRQATRPAPKPRTAAAPAQPARPAAQRPSAAQSSAPWPDPAAVQPQAQPAQSAAPSSSPAPKWPDPSTQANWPPPDPSTFSR